MQDPCILYTRNVLSTFTTHDEPVGFFCSQTDDTENLRTSDFAKKEEVEVKKAFRQKQATILRPGKSATYSGAPVLNDGGEYNIAQPLHTSKLEEVQKITPYVSDFVKQRARGSYITSVSRPDLSYGFAHGALVSSQSLNDCKYINLLIQQAKPTNKERLRYLKLYRCSLIILVYEDASFVPNKDSTTHLRVLIVLADKSNRDNTVQYHSCKAKRVTRSVLAAKLFAYVHEFDNSSILRHTLHDMFGKQLPLMLCTDSKILYEPLLGLKPSKEKRLLIDLAGLREAYELREISQIVWVSSHLNPTDGLTNQGVCAPLQRLIEKNQHQWSPKAWVERKGDRWTSVNEDRIATDLNKNDPDTQSLNSGVFPVSVLTVLECSSVSEIISHTKKVVIFMIE